MIRKPTIPRPPPALVMYTIYFDTRDFPGVYTSRRCEVRGGQVFMDPPAAHADSLPSIRESLPPGLYRIPRYPADDPTIVEVWL